ncbi:MAG TPA: hypothetical protein EYH20_04040 [Leucothrix sp.]|nr:hypothetical protein [Leucothrix sp.]
MKKIMIVVTCFLLNLLVLSNVYASEETKIKNLLTIDISDWNWNNDGSMDKAVTSTPTTLV